MRASDPAVAVARCCAVVFSRYESVMEELASYAPPRNTPSIPVIKRHFVGFRGRVSRASGSNIVVKKEYPAYLRLGPSSMSLI